ncbi:hypothetical protein CRG98_037409 [Punica granatum]|uniref:Uncharacterized protein n=1 Tax=Punica granatum TaxID=22663 RepID=A0A2I0IES2_PUNGR|nr:hypothetical protein CRG98_037409 [Punica granatum]
MLAFGGAVCFPPHIMPLFAPAFLPLPSPSTHGPQPLCLAPKFLPLRLPSSHRSFTLRPWLSSVVRLLLRAYTHLPTSQTVLAPSLACACDRPCPAGSLAATSTPPSALQC